MEWVSAELCGWGRYPRLLARTARPESRGRLVNAVASAGRRGVLAHGLGRSYGDAALLEDGNVVLTRRLDRMLSFDEDSGRLTCEAGVSIEDLLDVFMPRGWFPPVLPGTKFVTVGGAIANDIHGKNHHVDGTFADHVLSLDLLVASGDIVTASPRENPDLFWATVGGMGLTGVILSTTFQLKKVDGPWFDVESIRVRDLDQFFEISAQSSEFTHVVSWIDCLAKGKRLGRGIMTRGRHVSGDATGRTSLLERLPLAVPIDLPNLALNPLTMRLLNEGYYRKQWRERSRGIVHVEPWFFPLDAVGQWNRGYGKRGMLQYQVVVPPDPEHAAVRRLVELIAQSGLGSFLAVIKEFGDRDHGGLSFPKGGVTLALDFPNYGTSLLELLDRLDRIVVEAGGRVYLGKDARLSKDMFREMYPRWRDWKDIRDRWDSDGLFRSALGSRLGLVEAAARQPQAA